jgi:hypothetical protein
MYLLPNVNFPYQNKAIDNPTLTDIILTNIYTTRDVHDLLVNDTSNDESLLLSSSSESESDYHLSDPDAELVALSFTQNSSSDSESDADVQITSQEVDVVVERVVVEVVGLEDFDEAEGVERDVLQQFQQATYLKKLFRCLI